MTSMGTKKIFNYGGGADQSDELANRLYQYIDIFHIPSGQSLKFKAYITTFSDQYSSEWNSEDVYGRMDPIQTFKGTKRKISLGWDVPAGSFAEAKENMSKASALIAMLYPSYDDDGSGRGASSIAAPPLFKLKFVNLIQDAAGSPTPNASAELNGLLGTMSGFTYEPDLESGFFQPTRVSARSRVGTTPKTREPIFAATPVIVTNDKYKLFPQTIKFQAEFTVLHQHRPGFWNSGNTALPVAPFYKFPYSEDWPDYGEGMQQRQNTTQPPAPGGTPKSMVNGGGAGTNQTANGENLSSQQRQQAAAAAAISDPDGGYEQYRSGG